MGAGKQTHKISAKTTFVARIELEVREKTDTGTEPRVVFVNTGGLPMASRGAFRSASAVDTTRVVSGTSRRIGRIEGSGAVGLPDVPPCFFAGIFFLLHSAAKRAGGR